MERTITGILLTAALFTACKPEEVAPPAVPACTTTCLNGGTVTSDCNCDCPTGFYGANCQDQQTPTAFVVNQIVLTNWPATYDQNQVAYAWDNDGSGPDISFRFEIGQGTYVSTGHHANCVQGVQYTYDAQNDPAHFPFALSWGVPHDLKIMDEDGTTDQIMLDSSISLANFDSGLPTTLNLSADNGAFAFRLYGAWLF